MQLTPKQQECVRFLTSSMMDNGTWAVTVSGYAGTGKTTTISEFVNLLVAKDLRVGVAAPTNKATRVLFSKIGEREGLEYGSIHSFLGMQMTEYEDGTQKCEKKRDAKLAGFDVVIVDECSMIAREMYNEIKDNRGEAFIVFVGDPYQLPPVEGREKISPTFVKDSGKQEFVLSEIIRQAADNPIIGLSMKIREAEKHGERFDQDKVISYVQEHGDGRMFLVEQRHIVDLARVRIEESRGNQDESLSVRVVAWKNATVERVNAEIHQKIYGDTECPFSVGERVMAHSEFETVKVVKAMVFNPASGKPEMRPCGMKGTRIFTSEEVVITNIAKESHVDHQDIDAWKITFRREGKEVGAHCAYTPADSQWYAQMIDGRFKVWREMRERCQAEEKQLKKLEESGAHEQIILNKRYQLVDLNEKTRIYSGHTWGIRRAHAQIRHAYASTAHKAQGSTWHTVIVDMADLSRMPSDSDYNRALYVAVTRASDNLAIAI